MYEVGQSHQLLIDEVMADNLLLQQEPPYRTVTQRIQAWRELTEDKKVLQAIAHGIDIPISKAPEPLDRPVAKGQLAPLQSIIKDCVAAETVAPLQTKHARRTKHWIPMSVIRKRLGGSRLISQFCATNDCFEVPKFRPNSWATVVDLLKNPEYQYGVTLDMKSWFHHLQLSRKAQRWARFKVGSEPFVMKGMPFGLKSSPYWAHRLSQPVTQWMRDQGIACVWYVDDLLIVAKDRQTLEQQVLQVLTQLTKLGIQVNFSKSVLTPTTTLSYLGVMMNLVTKTFHAMPDKIKAARATLKHLLKASTVVPKFLAKAAGQLLDLAKAIQELHGLPKILMREAGKTVARQRRSRPTLKEKALWALSAPKPLTLRGVIVLALSALQYPTPTLMCVAQDAPRYQLYVDASHRGWGGTLQFQGEEVATAAQTWHPRHKKEHSTHLEAKAPLNVWESVAPLVPNGSHLTVLSDCTAVVWGLRKGSSKPSMNPPLRELRVQLAQRKIALEVLHVPGIQNERADYLSREPDAHHYHLRPEVFQRLTRHFQFHCEIDLFASATNSQVKKFYSWRHCKQAQGTNAFSHRWTQRCWLNPPWELALPALRKVQEDRTSALVLLPKWKNALWWPLLMQLAVAPPVTLQGSLYRGPNCNLLPPPKWSTVAVLVQG